MTTKPSNQLTLKDKLSRLEYAHACKLLGDNGERLLQIGGKFEILYENVHLNDNEFRLYLHEATVRIYLDAGAKHRLLISCTSCNGPCEHKGAALSYILDDKMSLGLSVPPPNHTPIESLDEAELITRAINDRKKRAKIEKMVVKSSQPKKVWTDYLVTNRESGKSYRVALRGFELGESYCSCPDFRKNTLGTCKHIFHTIDKVRTRFPKAALNKPYQRKRITLMLRYGSGVELRLLFPENLDEDVQSLVKPFTDRTIKDLRALLRTVDKLEAMGHPVTIHPDAEEYIQQQLILDRIQSKVEEIRKDPEGHSLRKTLLKAELLPYQLDGIAFSVGRGRTILADDMGLGKTIQGIGVAEFLALENVVDRVLIICPASLKAQWRSEIKRFSGRECQLILGKSEERARQYDSGALFTACNYEQVLRDITVIEDIKWDLIILDEGQRIKNWEAKTSRVIKGLRSPFALVLSGTPLENRLEELYSVVEFIDDKRLGPAFRFLNSHRIVTEKGKVLGYKNLSGVRENLEPVLLRRTRESVMQQLPPRSTKIIRISPTGEQLDLHGANMRLVNTIVKKKYLTEMDLLRLRKALLICRMAADSTYLVEKKEGGYSSKLERLDELFEQFSREKKRKIVLFSEWTTMLDLIETLLERHNLSFVRLDGKVPQRHRQALVEKFRNDPDMKFFITTNAGSTGLNLQMANTVVNVDLPWNPAVLEQRISRVHRMGQKDPIQVFILVTEETIEENMLATLSMKHQLSLAALDTESEVDMVRLQTGIDELRNRLEFLLGAKPDAALDESEKRKVEEAVGLAEREERIRMAGGQLLSAALNFFGEIITQRPANKEPDPMIDYFKNRLQECLSRDEKGRSTLTVTIPDASALTDLASSLAYLLSQSSQETKPDSSVKR